VHTIPEEIEHHKSSYLAQNLQRGAIKSDVQLKQCKQSNLIVCIGPRIFSEIYGKVNNSPLVTELKPGLSPELMKMDRDAEKLKRVNVLFQGRLEHLLLKGAPLAFAATKRIRKDPAVRPYDRPYLVMRGFEEDLAEFEKQCSAIGDDEGLKEFVQPRFFTTDKMSLSADMFSSSLLIMPSKNEGFGLVGLEAIASGMPVLLSANSGIAQLLSSDNAVSSALNPKTVELSICDVEGACEETVEIEWAKQMKVILSDRSSAFARADQLRKDLSKVLSWQAAARTFAADLSKL
ncbi:MAG: glycosyltransferase family 1 protein, partial [Proteobacteria bacterium]